MAARTTKDYNKIAKKKIRKPSTVKSHPSILVFARNKKGKSTLAASAPNVLILDPEGGTDEMRKKDPDVWPIEEWPDLEDAHKFLRLGDHNYEWVSPDGLTRMHRMALRFVMKQAEERDLDRRPGQITKRDYGNANELVQQMIINFHSLPMGVIYTAQERIISSLGFDEEGDEDETTMFVPDLPGGARAAINQVVDIMGRLYVKKVKVKNPKTDKISMKNQRRLYIGIHERYETGFRSDYVLPDEIKNPTVLKVVELMRPSKEQ